jgi:hypothetical protein
VLPWRARPNAGRQFENGLFGEEGREWAFRSSRPRSDGSPLPQAERVSLKLNNNRGDYPAINAMHLKEMLLEDWWSPERERLIDELQRRPRAGNRK